jgi:lipoprotein NlpI
MEAREGKKAKELNDRLCEAYYYLGEHRLFEGDREGARKYFQKSIDTEVNWFIEYQLSKVMLRQMNEGRF